MNVRSIKICTLLLCICLLLAACGGKNGIPAEETSDSSENPHTTETEAASEPSFSGSETSDGDLAEQEALAHYREIYSAEAVFSDLFVPQKYLIIGRDTVAELLLISGYSQTKEIRRDNIERLESKAFTDFCSIEIFDRTNEYLSVTVKSETAKEIAKLLQPKDSVKDGVSHE